MRYVKRLTQSRAVERVGPVLLRVTKHSDYSRRTYDWKAEPEIELSSQAMISRTIRGSCTPVKRSSRPLRL